MTTYDYIDYRKYLKAAVLAKKASSPSINFSRIAEEVGVQRSYLSQVFGFKCHLNSDQLYVIAKKLGLGEKEIEYLLILLDVEKSQVSARREKLIHLRDSLRNAHFKSENYLDRKTLKIDNGIYSQYYTDPYCSLVHMYLRDFTKRSHPISFERDQCLRVPSERQRRVYFRSDFLSTDFADSDRYPGPRRMMVLALG